MTDTLALVRAAERLGLDTSLIDAARVYTADEVIEMYDEEVWERWCHLEVLCEANGTPVDLAPRVTRRWRDPWLGYREETLSRGRIVASYAEAPDGTVLRDWRETGRN